MVTKKHIREVFNSWFILAITERNMVLVEILKRIQKDVLEKD